jgi:hypothetical protein
MPPLTLLADIDEQGAGGLLAAGLLDVDGVRRVIGAGLVGAKQT